MTQRLRVDMIACDGRGVCAELFPERISLDDWGYPIIDPSPIDARLQAHAKRAVAGCPLLALRLEPAGQVPLGIVLCHRIGGDEFALKFIADTTPRRPDHRTGACVLVNCTCSPAPSTK